MMIDKSKIKKKVIQLIPFIFFFYIGNHMSYSYRIANGKDISEKAFEMFSNFSEVFPLVSLNIIDLFFGFCVALIVFFVIKYKRKHRKNFKDGNEYGSARWGNHEDIEPYINKNDVFNNAIISQTESLTMGKPLAPKYARNLNTLVIGGAGSGKTRFYVKPNIMQMHSSYVVTDPKGTILIELGKMLERGKPYKTKNGKTQYKPYTITVFNTINFDKSMHYNPFYYIRKNQREQDILKLVECFIANTTEQKGGDEFWVKSEKLLYTAYISLILIMFPDEEHNFGTLIDLISISEVRESDESFKNAVDWNFYYLEKWVNNDWSEDEIFEEENEDYANMKNVEPEQWQIDLGKFAVSQYKQYKLAAGKTAKSILISCATRLAPFSIDKVREITSTDEMKLDEIGDRLTALFIIISDTDSTFNFLVGMIYSQLFNLLCEKADNNPDGSGKLKIPVRCLIDEFANIKQIPNFEKIIATIRSRQISASIILQNKAQLKANYKDNADTIEGNCDTKLFLGSTEQTTLKELSENMGKETIDIMNTSKSNGQSASYSVNYQKMSRDLMTREELAVMDNSKCVVQIRGLPPFYSDKFDITQHTRYPLLLDFDKKNYFDIGKYIEKFRKNESLCQMQIDNDTKIKQYEFKTD